MRAKQVVIYKVGVKDFIGALMDIYESGADYMDIVGIVEGNMTTLMINVKDEYMNSGEDDDEEEEGLTAGMINQLI